MFDYANSVSIVGVFADKPWVLAIYQSSETIIQIGFNLIGGANADNGNRKKIIIVTDIISAIICFLLSVFINSAVMAVAMIIANAILSVVFAFNSPTYKSIVREVIEKDRIGFFNSIQNGGGELIKITAPFVGIVLVNYIGVKGALIFDATTFLVSAIMEIFLLRIGESNEKKEKKNMVHNIAEGFKYLCKEKHIFYLVLLSAFVNFFLAGYNLLIPYTDVIYAENGFYSKVLAIQAVGGIIGSAICSRFGEKYSANEKIQIIFLAITGFTLVLEPLVTLSGIYILRFLIFLIFGIALTIFNIQFMSYVQIRVKSDYLGRVFSIIFTVAVFFMPIGSVVFSFIYDTTTDISFAIIGIGIVVLSIISLFWFGSMKKK